MIGTCVAATAFGPRQIALGTVQAGTPASAAFSLTVDKSLFRTRPLITESFWVGFENQGVIRQYGVESVGMIDIEPIRVRFGLLSGHLNEREKRLLAASEAATLGYGGIIAVSNATGIARSTIGRGLEELDAPPLESGRVRRSGAGRPRAQKKTQLLSQTCSK
jgi:hypothetical protein